mgnify:CR=1
MALVADFAFLAARWRQFLTNDSNPNSNIDFRSVGASNSFLFLTITDELVVVSDHRRSFASEAG